MLEAMHTAAAGMAAQQARMDAVASDLANVSTTGYKPVRLAFRDLVYADGGRGAAPGVGLGSGAAATAIGRGTRQGALQETGEPLDVALSGPGYLAVRAADGTTALTRDGHLRLSDKGQLTTAAGLLLDPPITVPAGTSAAQLQIAPDGTVSAGAKKLGALRLLDVPAPSQLRGGPDNTLTPTTGSGATRAAGARTTLTQGSLESSAVDLGTAMTDLVDAQRSFELVSKVIQTQDQMLEIANGVKR